MKQKTSLPPLSLVLLFFTVFVSSFVSLYGQDTKTEEREYPNRADNAKCFACHGHKSFRETSRESGETIMRNMYPSLIIDTVKFYESNHWSFGCMDCHSYDYLTYPHPRESKFEYIPICLDCHEGDEVVEKYHFEKIAEEYEKSYHTTLTNTKYSCWSCHDPHSFRMEVRKEELITKVVANDNAMCLKCHSGTTAAQLLLGTGLEPLVAAHDWLPETVNHFRNVRCIECHAVLVDDVLVAHDILPAKQAVKTCAECHSSDSRLLYSLYKYEIQSGRMKKGWFGSMVSTDSYVIGANRNPLLNWISLIIFGGVIFIVLVHITIRIIKK